MSMERIAMLKEVLAGDPNNVLARYGLAMEYSKWGQTDEALAEFNALIAANPAYVAAYQQAAQTLINAERFDDAKVMLEKGTATAESANNPHAKSEMEMMLEEISR
jgi:cytochrome c-type biogenesis protein CcmH/NrfG